MHNNEIILLSYILKIITISSCRIFFFYIIKHLSIITLGSISYSRIMRGKISIIFLRNVGFVISGNFSLDKSEVKPQVTVSDDINIISWIIFPFQNNKNSCFHNGVNSCVSLFMHSTLLLWWACHLFLSTTWFSFAWIDICYHLWVLILVFILLYRPLFILPFKYYKGPFSFLKVQFLFSIELYLLCVNVETIYILILLNLSILNKFACLLSPLWRVIQIFFTYLL